MKALAADDETGSVWSDPRSVCGCAVKAVTQTRSLTAVPGAVTVGQCLPSSAQWSPARGGGTAPLPCPLLQAALEQMRTCDDVLTQVVSSSVPHDYTSQVELFWEHVDSIVI